MIGVKNYQQEKRESVKRERKYKPLQLYPSIVPVAGRAEEKL